ncbi:unnamed protein product (mitochondrion) [Sympodiomycopsis kandeliae]
MIIIMITIPFLACLYLSTVDEGNFQNIEKIKKITLFSIIVTFLVSLFAWAGFDSLCHDYQFTFNIEKSNFINFHVGLDGISLFFVILTTFIIPISLLSNWSNIKKSIKIFLITFLILESLLLTTFIVLDIILFYVFFESVLIPLFLIVGIWGGSDTRVRASFLLFLYTLLGSLFMLLAFLSIYRNVGRTDFNIILVNQINEKSQIILFLCIFLSMAIKTPLIPFNTWLTYAHAEAPVGGSIVLAGLILKLATYGYLRIILQFLPDASQTFRPILQTTAVITLIYASLSSLRQTDFKKLVAYSSVAHQATIVLGVFSNNLQGLEGSIILGIAHGLVSPGLFFLVGGVLYDRYHTRIIKYYRGLNSNMPIFSILFFLFTISNAAVPLSANWIGEILCLIGIFQENAIIACIASLGIVFSACYSIFLYNRIAFQSVSKYFVCAIDINRREFIVILPLILITVFIGIFPNTIIHNIHVSLSHLIY